MRLKSLEVQGFRGFGQHERIGLDADTVILVGVNGSGKTSLFDAVIWSLTGRLPRVEDAEGSVISEYAVSGEARVAVEIRLGGDRELTVVRSRSREEDATRLQVEIDGSVLRSSEAQVVLYRELWPDALSAPDGGAALLTALTRSVYLQQDLVREFVEADNDAQRFETVSELVGVGRVRELQVELDKARRAWSQATNKFASEVEPRAQRLRALDSQLERLSSATSVDTNLEASMQAWWRRLADTFGELAPRPPGVTRETAPLLDDALKALAAERRRDERRMAEAQGLLAELSEVGPVSEVPVGSLVSLLDEARASEKSAVTALEGARTHEAQLREQAIRAEEQSAQLSALAELALKHLSDRCPVCTQKHDREKTVAHLRSLIDPPSAKEVAETAARPDVESLSRAVTERQHRVSDLEAQLQQRRAQALARGRAATQREARLAALELGDGPAEDSLRQLLSQAETRHLLAIALQKEGEDLALALARSGEMSRHAQLSKERDALASSVARDEAHIAARRESGDLAGNVLEALRDAASGLVDSQLGQIAPLVERVYARIDPHPAFRTVKLSSNFERGRGRVRTSVADALENVVVRRPGTVLSSSQLNALAVSIFLALNLGVPARPLDAVLLDDPLQSLDDVNLLGLVDLLRRTKQRRQLIISTHDARFAALLERKLRPDATANTIVVELSGWRREGPRVSQKQVLAEKQQMRLVA
jgi:exonuclease SbcC